MSNIIEQARRGEVAVENTGTKDQLQMVLRYVWPADGSYASGDQKYYIEYNKIWWSCRDYIEIPSYPVSDFLAAIEAEQNSVTISKELLTRLAATSEEAKAIVGEYFPELIK